MSRHIIPIFELDMLSQPPMAGSIGATIVDSIVMVFPYSGQQPVGTAMGIKTAITLCNGETYMSPWSQREVEDAMRHD